MASALANSFGTIGGSRASPTLLLDSTVAADNFSGANVIEIQNLDSTNWFLFRAKNLPTGVSTPFVVVLPGASAILARGQMPPGLAGPVAYNGIFAIEGFGCTPSEAGTANVLVTIKTIKSM